MAKCETVEVKHGSGSKWINASDFDKSKHKLVKAPAKKPGKKPGKIPVKKDE